MKELAEQLGLRLPADYVSFLQTSNGAEGPVGHGYISLWPIEEIVILNEQYEVVLSAPGLILLGSDGANVGYAIDRRTHGFVEVPLIGLSLEAVSPVGSTLGELLEHVACGS